MDLPDPQQALRQLADERAALRRVAELAARGAARSDVLHAVAAQASRLTGVDFVTLLRFEPDGTTEIVALHGPPHGIEVGMRAPGDGDGAVQETFRTGAPAHRDDLRDVAGRWPSLADARGYRSSAAAPIVLDGALWGTLVVTGADGPLSPETREGLAGFAELAGTAIAAVQARDDARRLAEEQAALRRVAELGARRAASAEVFEAIVQEASDLVGGAATVLATIEAGAAHIQATCRSDVPVGMRFPVDPAATPLLHQLVRTRRPVRGDRVHESAASAAIAGMSIVDIVGVPIEVGGELWGFLSTHTPGPPPPPSTEAQLTAFARLAAAAISGSRALRDLQELADDQAALRRIAEVVARGASPDEVAQRVTGEAAALLGGRPMTLSRLDGEALEVVATAGGPAPAGAGVPFAEHSAPVVVEGQVWGHLAAASPGAPLDPGMQARLAQFAKLAGVAIAGAQTRKSALALLAEQTALRRIAELVAHGVAPDELFAAVTVEASKLLDDHPTTMTKIEPGNEIVVVAVHGSPATVGARIAFTEGMLPALVRRSGRPVRIDDYTPRGSPIAREYRLAAAVGAPILVEGEVWGVMAASSSTGPLPSDAEERLGQFAELVGAAIANTESHAQLAASRARVIAASDETRRRLQRDLHDGAQQRLVQTVITLRLAVAAMRKRDTRAEGLVEGALEHAMRATDALRDLARGMLPAALERGGLRTGIATLVSGLSLPVELDVEAPRLTPDAEAAAYFVVAEALTNVVKHAAASRATVRIAYDADGGMLSVRVRDDGVGGANASPDSGTGLVGLSDRVAAARGTLAVTSE
ncbi:MAG TPA: GAF domain-containing protein, partial [Solirubrobacteraceae bacterium]